MKLLENFLQMRGGQRIKHENATQTLTTQKLSSLATSIQLLSKPSHNPVKPVELPVEIAKLAMEEIMSGSAPQAQITAFLIGLSIHGASPQVSW
jgi:anthranilate phosphoribosyltransferase